LIKIAIASGKGGTGKTTLAANLALRASETRRTVLADLDVEEPNSGIFVKGDLISQQQMFRQVPVWDQAGCTLCGNCTEVCQYNAILKLGKTIMVLLELCHSCHACSELCPTDSLPMRDTALGWLRSYRRDKLSFIESRLEIGVEMASPLIRQTIGYLHDEHQEASLQVRDCPPGTSCSVISATKDADFIILVTEPTPFGLYDLSLAVDTMRHLDKAMAVVINRHGIGNDDVISYCKRENLTFWGMIPHLREIAELYSRGEMIYPRVDAFRQELDNIIGHIDQLGGRP
jgi:MinD superfamily P-loop ATPase